MVCIRSTTRMNHVTHMNHVTRMNHVTHMNQSYHTQKCSGLGTPRPQKNTNHFFRTANARLWIVCVHTLTWSPIHTHTHNPQPRRTHTIHNQDSRYDSTTETFLTATVSVVEYVRHTHTHTIHNRDAPHSESRCTHIGADN